MRLVVGLAFIVDSMVGPAMATPANMVCQASSADVSIFISLSTSNSRLNTLGITPLAVVHSNLKFSSPVAPGIDQTIGLFYSDMVAQWLHDDRVDMQFYKEETNKDGKIISFNLVIKTRSTGVTSEESGIRIHRGTYQLDIYAGSPSLGAGINPAIIRSDVLRITSGRL